MKAFSFVFCFSKYNEFDKLYYKHAYKSIQGYQIYSLRRVKYFLLFSFRYISFWNGWDNFVF